MVTAVKSVSPGRPYQADAVNVPAVYKRFVDTMEKVREAGKEHDLAQLELNLEDLSEAQAAHAHAVREAAIKAKDMEAYAYYQTVAGVIVGGIGVALLSTGMPAAMWSGAALCGVSASSLLSLYFDETDPAIQGGIALIASGLSLIAQHLGYLGDVAASPQLIAQVALAVLAFTEATSAQQREVLEARLEELRALQVKHQSEQRLANFRGNEIIDMMRDAAQRFVDTVEQIKRILQMEADCRSQIVIELKG